MAFTAYMTLKGSKSGDVKGDVIQKGREGQIAVYAAEHSTHFPTDAAGTGQATGRRRHTALAVTKEIDRSSPLLHTILNTNETLKEVVLNFFGPAKSPAGGQGIETLVYTIKLLDARIVSMQMLMENNRTEPGKTLPVLETLQFAFETIEWNWKAGGITSTDTVKAP